MHAAGERARFAIRAVLYSSPIIIEPGQTQYFNARIRAQQYASGGTVPYQQGFIVVLLMTFVLSAGILLYLLIHRHRYFDFGDPRNLFPLAAVSPPTRQSVENSCEMGGDETHFRQFWKGKRACLLGDSGGAER